MSKPDPWSRRKLLTARGLGASTGGMLAALLPDPPLLLTGQDDRSAAQWTVTRRAMACEFTIHLHPLTRDPITVANTALREIERLEDVMTVYRPTSEMSRVNAEAFDHPVPVSESLFSLLQRAAELHNQTERAFDIATGRLIKAWGFFAGPRHVPEPDEHAAAMAACGLQHVHLDEAQRTVRYDASGLEINLGSIGKGYALDEALRRLRQEFGVECCLITGGSSSMIGIGSLWGDDSGWLIAIEDPEATEKTIATVRLRNRALGTSSAANQHFEAGGKRYGHLLDPRTGRPADALAGVTVLAPDAATADALATAFFVMGLDKSAEFCQNHPEIAAILVRKHGDIAADVASAARGAGSSHLEPMPTRPNPRVVTFNLPPHDVTVDFGNGRGPPRV